MSAVQIILNGVLFICIGCGVFVALLPAFGMPIKKTVKRAVFYIPAMEALVALVYCLLALSIGCLHPAPMGELIWHGARLIQICFAGIIANKALANTGKSSWSPILHTGAAAVLAQIICYIVERFIIF